MQRKLMKRENQMQGLTEQIQALNKNIKQLQKQQKPTQDEVTKLRNTIFETIENKSIHNTDYEDDKEGNNMEEETSDSESANTQNYVQSSNKKKIWNKTKTSPR